MRSSPQWMIGIALLVSGCVSLPVQQRPEEQAAAYPPSAFAHSVVSNDLVLDWNCERLADGTLRLTGVARNRSRADVRLLEFDLTAVDGTGRIVSQSNGRTQDAVLRQNEVSPFRLDVPVKENAVRLDLSYRQGSVRVRRNGVLVRPFFQTQGTDWSHIPDICPGLNAGVVN